MRHWFELEPDQFLRRFVSSCDEDSFDFDFKSTLRDAKECLAFLEKSEAEEREVARLIGEEKYAEAKDRLENFSKNIEGGSCPWVVRLSTMLGLMKYDRS